MSETGEFLCPLSKRAEQAFGADLIAGQHLELYRKVMASADT
jgi:hypothetical protein